MKLPDRVVVAGAGGFIGKSFVSYLCKQGVPVFAISRSFQWSPDSFVRCGLDVLVSDLSSLSTKISHIQDASLIVYMAGSTNLGAAEQNPIADFQSHSDSLLTFLSSLSSHQRFIFLSSGGAIYGEPLMKSKKVIH